MFKGKEKSTTSAKRKNTFIAKELEVQGDFNGAGDVQIEGTLHGDISVSSVIIGEHGTINGIIRATNVIVNGKLNGSIFCNLLEVLPNGRLSNNINVQKLLISGSVEGSIDSKDKITVEKKGNINATTMKSKNIIIHGKCKGRIIASELLEIGSTGSVEGEIIVKNIKTHKGGQIIGSIKFYVEETSREDSLD